MSPLNPTPARFLSSRLEGLQRDLRGLVALESLQLAFGAGALVAIAIHAVAVTTDPGAAASIALVLVLALVHLAGAFRIRRGQELLRRDLHLVELRRELGIETAPHSRPLRSGEHDQPYRSSAWAPQAADRPQCVHLALVAHGALALLTITGGALLLHLMMNAFSIR